MAEKGRVFLVFFMLLSVPAVGQEINEEQFWIDGRQVYLAYPCREQSGEMPVLMAIHGSGREAASYIPDSKNGSAFYQHQRELALSCGYLFVVVSNGADTWGTDKGLDILQNVYESVSKVYSVQQKWVLWGNSAGGVLMNRMVRTYPERVKKVIGTFPVYDLEESYQHLASARKAWKSEEEFRMVNPVSDPLSLTKVPYLLFHGTEDSAVPSCAHSERLAKEVNDLGGEVQLYLVPGGHSTDNWSLYQDEKIKLFLID